MDVTAAAGEGKQAKEDASVEVGEDKKCVVGGGGGGGGGPLSVVIAVLVTLKVVGVCCKGKLLCWVPPSSDISEKSQLGDNEDADDDLNKIVVVMHDEAALGSSISSVVPAAAAFRCRTAASIEENISSAVMLSTQLKGEKE